MTFSVSDGVLGLLATANKAKASDEYTFYLAGDLCQMAEQDSFLKNQGFSLGRSDVYPLLKECDVFRALNLIYEYKVTGWWNYKDRYVKYNICTANEFKKALEIQCSK
jgi:hypothetical protein